MDVSAELSSLQHDSTRLSPDSSDMSHHHHDNSSNLQSISSTPLTSVSDESHITSSKTTTNTFDLKVELVNDHINSTPTDPGSSRSRRDRKFQGTYNDRILAGKAIRKSHVKHDKRAIIDASPRRRTISGDTLVAPALDNGIEEQDVLETSHKDLISESIDALNLPWSPPKLSQSRSMMIMARNEEDRSADRSTKRKSEPNRRISTRSAGIQPMDLAHTLSTLGKRARNQFEAKLAKGKRELRRLADTNEFAKIEDQPVIHTVWANGKFVPADSGVSTMLPRKRVRTEEPVEEEVVESRVIEKPAKKLKGPKKYVIKGFFAGQNGEDYWSNKYRTGKDLKAVRVPGDKPNGTLPLPIYAGDRMIQQGRDFKLPFWICNPLPPGQPKPDEWRRMPKNRFVGDAQAAWKKSTLFDEFTSRCICAPETGCDDDCQNRIMLYECDERNCKFRANEEKCHNQPFADLGRRKNAGGKYNIGVEVIKTIDRGYGVRSNRSFRANQIITEYTGEIITELECDRRMNEEYVNNSCYYLMSFDQNTILDATEKGSIARFVNHSCEPNCRMVKWVVQGKPRMALFADRDIMTGEELTYDYNFDPFSAKNVQECRCGARSCRGILGPRPKDPKFLKPVTDLISTMKTAVVEGITKGKRKLQEFLGDGLNGESADEADVKKRKIKDISSALKRALPKTTKGAIAALKEENKIKNRSPISSVEKRRPGASGSRNSSLTIVNTEDGKSISSKKSTSSLQRAEGRGAETTPRAKKGGYVRKGGWGGNRRKDYTPIARRPTVNVDENESLKASSLKSNVVVLKTGSRDLNAVAQSPSNADS